MALGFSGSNGGIVEGKEFSEIDLLNRPLEVSYFVNNICNLNCGHCYVGYSEQNGELSVSEWNKTFDSLIEKGALTFGNVGKEPLLSKEKTLGILSHLKEKREENPRIRYGLVTNGTLLKGDVVEGLSRVSPDYIDVSFDGLKEEHDYVRGEGNYEKTFRNLEALPSDLKEKIFISFTLMNHNKNSLKGLVNEITGIGINKFLVSPYVQSQKDKSGLGLSEEEVVNFYRSLAEGKGIKFSELDNVTILLKSDYDAQKPLMDKLVDDGVIDVNNLLVDDYWVIFNKYDHNGSEVIINYIPFSDTLSRSVRISHDGYVGGCLEMFYEDYPKRAKANLKEKNIDEILFTT